MAVRQYIGARYVTKIYENSVDPSSAEWEASVNYEPLTMVTYNNGSYLSKKEVPASVGNPADNLSYWVQTGFYNGQIASLQNQIDIINNTSIPNIQDQIDTLNNTTIPSILNFNFWHNKKVLVLGDSLGAVTHNYWRYLADIDDTIDIDNQSVGGTVISDCLTTLQSMSADDFTDYDIIVIAYGTNMWQGSEVLATNISTYRSCFNEIRDKAPSIEIINILPFYSYHPNFGASTINYRGLSIDAYNYAIEQFCNELSVPCINFYPVAGVNYRNYTTLLENSNNIYVHEGEILGKRLAKIVYNFNPHEVNSTPYYMQSESSGVGLAIQYINRGFHIFTFGSPSVSWLTSLDLSDFIGSDVASGPVVGATNGNVAVCVLSTGTLLFNWFSNTADTKINGLNLFTMRSATIT